MLVQDVDVARLQRKAWSFIERRRAFRLARRLVKTEEGAFLLIQELTGIRHITGHPASFWAWVAGQLQDILECKAEEDRLNVAVPVR